MLKDKRGKVPLIRKRNGGPPIRGKREANHGAYSPPQTKEDFGITVLMLAAMGVWVFNMMRRSRE